jgi:Ubiquitin-2 like Rad60 SUMO-like
LTDTESEDENTTFPVREPANQPVIIEDDDNGWDAPAPRRAPRPVVEDDLQFSDEEFPELIQQAKERERQKMQQKLNGAKAFGEQNHGANGSGTPVDILDDIFDSGSRAAFDSDPTIEILITSKIEGTVPLKVRRKLSQRLKEVRLSWCDKQSVNGQPFDQNIKDAIYLTWKKIKLFDVTTCRSLGLKIDGRGNLSGNGEGLDAEGRIHMEAWTEETYKIYEKRKAAKQKRERSESDGEAAAQHEKENAVQKTKLIMRARNLDDYKITVKATTTIERMIGAFRQGRGVPDEKQIAIHLEGDELDPATTIGELDLEDMDIVEVHFR